MFKSSDVHYKENRIRLKKITLIRCLSGRKLCYQAVFLLFFIPVCVYLTVLDLEKKMHWTGGILFTVQICFSSVLVVLLVLNTFRSSLMAVQNYTLWPVTGRETPKIFLICLPQKGLVLISCTGNVHAQIFPCWGA